MLAYIILLKGMDYIGYQEFVHGRIVRWFHHPFFLIKNCTYLFNEMKSLVVFYFNFMQNETKNQKLFDF